MTLKPARFPIWPVLYTSLALLWLTVVSGFAQDSPSPADENNTPEKNENWQKIGGGLTFNYMYYNWEDYRTANKSGGTLAFEFFKVTLDGELERFPFSVEYRIYPGYNLLHHGWFGYRFSPESEIQLGVNLVPFGILPYASHSWYGQVTYCLGLEIDYDTGVKFIYTPGNFDLQLAFYKQDEGNFQGNSTDSARYSYDVVEVDSTNSTDSYLGIDSANSETNQGNLRLAYRFGGENPFNIELGGSGQYGQIFNSVTGKNGEHWAGAAHADINLDRINVMLEAVRYQYHLQNPPGIDDRFVAMGAYDIAYKVASAANVFMAGVSYTFTPAHGPLTSVSIYNDFSLMDKDEKDYYVSQQNVAGIYLEAGPVYAVIDYAAGVNIPWIGGDYGSGLAEGEEDEPWLTGLNINLGLGL